MNFETHKPMSSEEKPVNPETQMKDSDDICGVCGAGPGEDCADKGGRQRVSNPVRICTCLNCGWVHFALTRKAAEQEVAEFNAYFETLTSEQQQDYYGGKKSRIENYEHCFHCGKPANMREAKDGDCPRGCTIQPVIWDPVGVIWEPVGDKQNHGD